MNTPNGPNPNGGNSPPSTPKVLNRSTSKSDGKVKPKNLAERFKKVAETDSVEAKLKVWCVDISEALIESDYKEWDYKKKIDPEMTIKELKEEFLEFLKGKGYNSIKQIHILIGGEYLTDEKTFKDYQHLFIKSKSQIKVYIHPPVQRIFHRSK